MKRIFVLMLFALLVLPVRGQYGVTMSGALRDGIGRVTNSAAMTVNSSGEMRVAGDDVTWYSITNANSTTNLVVNAPIKGLQTLPGVSDGSKCPEIVSLMVISDTAFDFEIQPFSQPATNGTYTAGTAITTWGNDSQYMIPAITQTMLTNAYRYSWRTNGGVAILDAPSLSHPVPIAPGLTNLQYLFVSKSTGYLTNGVKILFGVK